MNTLKKFGKGLLRVIGYLLMGVGGLGAFASVLSAPAMLLSPEMDAGLGERIASFVICILYAAVSVVIYRLGSKLKKKFPKDQNVIVAQNRKKFLRIYGSLFKDGTLREVYTGKTLSIFAVVEQCYAVTPFTEKRLGDAHLFLPLADQQVPSLIQNESLFDQLYARQKSKNDITILTKDAIQGLRKRNRQRLEKGTWRITSESENALLGKTPSKPQEEKASSVQHDIVQETREDVSGTLRASSPKYQNIESAIKILAQHGFVLVRIFTDGETSSHMWCVGFNKEYESFQAFTENVYADYSAAVSGSSSGPNLEWASTSFRLANADNVLVNISIVEDDGDVSPRTADFRIGIPEVLPPEKKTEIMRIRDELAALEPQPHYEI